MSRSHQILPLYSPYQDSTISAQRYHRPLPRQQVHRAIPLQSLPSISASFHNQERPLPSLPSDVETRNIASRRSGLVVRHSPLDFEGPNDVVFGQNEHEGQTIHISIKPTLTTAIFRITATFRNLITNYIIEWWLLEILSWCFSAACMTAIFGVFLKFDDETQPKFPLGITINGFISVFSVCAKAALILPTAEGLGQLKWSHFKEKPRPLMDIERIDLASRGPYGAVLLLGRARRMLVELSIFVDSRQR